jgi:hypothetical protein
MMTKVYYSVKSEGAFVATTEAPLFNPLQTVIKSVANLDLYAQPTLAMHHLLLNQRLTSGQLVTDFKEAVKAAWISAQGESFCLRAILLDHLFWF